jgi:hypothetical protein
MTNKERQASFMEKWRKSNNVVFMGVQSHCSSCDFQYDKKDCLALWHSKDWFLETCPCAKAYNRMARKRRIL